MLQQLFPEGIYLIPEKDMNEKLPENDVQSASTEDARPLPDGPQAGPQPATEPPGGLPRFRGKNLRQVLVIYDNPGELTSAMEEFLSKVLKAVGLNMEDIALISGNEYPEQWVRIPARKMLVFGTQLVAELPAEPYVLTTLGNRTALRAASLALIMGDKQHKTRLWQALRQMFDV